MQTSVNSFLTVYTAASWQYFINLELRTLSTWHSNQQVDGGHYEAEAEMIVDAIKCMLWQLVTLPVCVGVFDVRMFNLLSCFMFFFLPGSSLYNSVLVLNVIRSLERFT
jgi:hypothetical protein